MAGTSNHVSVGAGTVAVLIGALLGGGVCGAQPAGAATLYVRTMGSDANDGLTPVTAFQTIRHAAQSLINAGDHVVVGPGTYPEGDISPAHNGIPNRPIVFSADSSGALTGDPPGPVIVMPPVEQTTGFIVLGHHDIVIDGFTIVGALDAAVQVRRDDGRGLNSHSISITNNVVRNSAKRGIDVSVDGSVVIHGNITSHNGSSGITARAEPGSIATLEVSNNTATANGGLGILVEGVPSLGDCNNDGAVTINEMLTGVNVVLGSQAASVCRAFDVNEVGAVTVAELISAVGASVDGSTGVPSVTSGIVQNNVICSNGDDGVSARAAKSLQIANNLIYANAGNGVTVGSGGESDAATSATVVNNTIYKNAAWGLAMGNEQIASPGALVVNNIINLNVTGGMAVQQLTQFAEYVSGFNLNTDGYGPETRASVYDFSSDPLFVDPPGADGILGGDGFADDDFRLRSSAQRSAAIDAGSGPTSRVGITGSAEETSSIDTGTVDLGYHYDASPNQTITVSVPDLFMPIYVRIQGDPSNDGLSPQHALSAISAAGLKATSSTTIIVGPGRYNEGDVRVKQLARDVTFLADPSGAATGDPPGVVLVDATGTGRDTGFVLVDGPGAIIDGFYVTGGNAAGIQVRAGSDGAQIRNNVVFSNQHSGIEALDASDVQVQNNLVYANGAGGIRVAQGNNGTVLNNTAYGNGGDGILAGGGAGLTPTRGTVIMRNIAQGNQKGILATDNAFEGYVTGFNVALDGFEGHTPRADSDLIADALFVDPAGADGILGGTGFADDDFHLIQDGVVTSPAVDLDYTQSNTLTSGSTRSDGAPDTGFDDAGYHYPVK